MMVQAVARSGGTDYPPGTPVSDAALQTPAPPPATAAWPTALPTPEEVRVAVSAINRAIQSFVSHLEFCVEDDSRVIVVKVVDTRSKEVLREFSAGKVLGIANALDKVQGLLLEESA